MDRRLYIVSNVVIDSFLNQVSKEIKDEIILERSLPSVEKVDWAGGMRMVNG